MVISMKHVRVFMIACCFVASLFPAASFAALEPKRTSEEDVESQVQARAYVVMDYASGKILTMKQENLSWPIASLTKLMTANVLFDELPNLKSKQSIVSEDDVGGAKLIVRNGDKLTIQDLFYAMFLGSANNATNALSRTSRLSKEDFVAKMNKKAKTLALENTAFVDPTGIDPQNTSTVLDMAKIAKTAFRQPLIRKWTTTPKKTIAVLTSGKTKEIKNTNWMLTRPEYKAIFVTAGKTGYLEESNWNFVTTLRPTNTKQKELLIVVFGSPSRAQSFQDTKMLANWAWKSYAWKKEVKTVSR